MARFGIRELRKSDFAHISKLVTDATLYNTALIQHLIDDVANFPGWLYGALEDGTELQAMMAIHDHSAVMYSDSDDAVEAMASHLLKSQRIIGGSRTNRHHIIGPAHVVGPFWVIFRALDRQLVSDVNRHLMASIPSDKSPSKRLKIGFAKESDLRTIFDFTAAYEMEMNGKDPRKVDGRAHHNRCLQAIKNGRQIMGREEGRPVFTGEFRQLRPNTFLLDRVFIPPAFRTRRRLVGAALYKSKYAPAVRDKELLFFADTPSMVEAAQLGGFEQKVIYRSITTVG
jgi:hypothetical protein